jgi:hypothetical protein
MHLSGYIQVTGTQVEMTAMHLLPLQIRGADHQGWKIPSALIITLSKTLFSPNKNNLP